ncbi:hypothetical protein E2562_036050 [Oryza meyeriana var. granulata]|uniref:CCHC-type domain-containing protein n=1 Tax=Oryza meyeriana var. granulata TaxID=110450 RepID=A0A6G1D9H2_9ORYZ|nr:hypothetical protein E2562_036050 [Oryza meyeriana var. granulata]
MPVKQKYWWRHQPHSSGSNSNRRNSYSLCPTKLAEERTHASPALCLFKEKTKGKCFVYLARDHRTTACRDPVHCLSCRRSGHRANDCRRCRFPVSSPALPSRPPPPNRTHLPPPLVRPPGLVMALLGDPETRLGDDNWIIPTSFTLDNELREWEATAVVT